MAETRPAVEFTAPNGTRFIFDCGTGLRMLGNHWAQTLGVAPIEAWVLVTHTIGTTCKVFPFHPFFEPQNRFPFLQLQSEYLGPDSLSQGCWPRKLSGPYFPVPVSMMSRRVFFMRFRAETASKWTAQKSSPAG